MYPADVIARFWSHVDKSGGPDACWVWTGARTGKGYGSIKINKRMRRAHRVAWEIEHGPIPAGLFVLHKCDNPPCVRHLRLGTHEENMADMSAKKRAPGSKKGRKGWAGNRNFIPPWTKLSPEQVFLIRQKQAAGVPTKELATEFQVHRTHINRLVRGARRQNILT